MASYLQTSAQYGGRRYGPFYGGSISLGTNPGQCQIVVPQAFGMGPVHAILQDHNNGTFMIQPAMTGLSVHLIRAGDPKLWPVQGPTQMRAGDAFILGNANGPRFDLQFVAVPVEQTATGPSWFAKLFGGGGGVAQQGNANMGHQLGREVRRQAEASALTKIPLYREFYQFRHRLESGAYFRPRYIIGAAIGLVGLLGIGAVGCFGGLAALWRSGAFH